MNVTSYLELSLALFGWFLYGSIWDVMLETGIAYLPFIGMLLKNITTPIRSQEAKDASTTSLRRIEIETFTMLTVVVLASQPVLTLGFNDLNYTLACSSQPTVHTGSTDTSYDSTFTTTSLGGDAVKVPIWWTGVLALSGGFNDAVILSIPCTTDIRLAKYTLNNSRIKDPHLRRQVQLFYNDCYHDAMAEFLDKKHTYPSDLPQDDLYWLGSQYLVDNLYDGNRRSSTEIPGFTYESDRDLEYNPAIYLPVDGKPTCKQWWTGQGHNSNIGLRQALLDQIETDDWTRIQEIVADLTGQTETAVENIGIKTLINRERSYFNGLHNLSSYNDHSLNNTLNTTAATAGALLESISFYPKLYLVKMAAPIIQAMVLMVIYLLLPFVMLFSSYDTGTMVFMSIVIFAVKFWTVLWAVAHWLDNQLIPALAPDTWYRFDLAQNNLLVEMIINFTTGAMFIVLPLFWSGVLGWAGFKVGHEINSAVGTIREPSATAGQRGGNTAKSVANKVVKK